MTDAGQPTILIVEDNPSLRKMERLTLLAEGFDVIEAGNGAEAIELSDRHEPQLVIMDLGLPDVDGIELGRLLALRGGEEVTVIALSGSSGGLRRARESDTPFAETLLKPVDPQTLANAAVRVLGQVTPDGEPGASRGRLIVADDDRVQRKLLATRLQRLGFEVEVAADGVEALQAARREPPAAIVSDVLMPRLDGFMLCHECRHDARLRDVPIVLASNAYVEDRDVELARKAGASAFVARTPRMDQVIAEVNRLIEEAGPAPAPQRGVKSEHAERLARQLELQVAENHRLARARDLGIVQLNVLSGLSGALSRAFEIDTVFEEVLERALEVVEAGAIGLVVLDDTNEPQLRAARGPSAHLIRTGPVALIDAVGRAALGNEPAVVTDNEQHDRKPESFAVIPFANVGDHRGALVLVGDPKLFNEEMSFLRTLAAQVGEAVGLGYALAEAAAAREQTILRLARAAEYRDDDTGAHNSRMSSYAAVIARAYGIERERIAELRQATLMHDVGKIGVPDSILLKPGKLSEQEFELMKKHTVIGHEILGGSGDPLLDKAAEIALTHHERFDGRGYPRGLAGEQIPLEGRITAIADVFDALTSDRVYRPAFSVEQALEMMTAERATQFDPELFAAFERSLDEILAIRSRMNDHSGAIAGQNDAIAAPTAPDAGQTGNVAVTSEA